MSDANTITDDQINALRREAIRAGDSMQIAVCDVALEDGAEALTTGQIGAGERDYSGGGISAAEQRRIYDMTQDEARAECARVIAAAAAQGE